MRQISSGHATSILQPDAVPWTTMSLKLCCRCLLEVRLTPTFGGTPPSRTITEVEVSAVYLSSYLFALDLNDLHLTFLAAISPLLT